MRIAHHRFARIGRTPANTFHHPPTRVSRAFQNSSIVRQEQTTQPQAETQKPTQEQEGDVNVSQKEQQKERAVQQQQQAQPRREVGRARPPRDRFGFGFSLLDDLDRNFLFGRDPLFGDLDKWRRSLTRELDRSLRTMPTLATEASFFDWQPRADILTSGENVVITAELPGVAKDNIKVELDTNTDTLTIRGERKEEKESKDASFYQKESAYGSFQRVFTLPSKVDPKQIKANYKDGVLTITLPRESKGAETVQLNVE